jgi:hypothetical protein
MRRGVNLMDLAAGVLTLVRNWSSDYVTIHMSNKFRQLDKYIPAVVGRTFLSVTRECCYELEARDKRRAGGDRRDVCRTTPTLLIPKIPVQTSPYRILATIAQPINDKLTLRGIPPEAFDYRLGNRSAIDWIIDQYQLSTDKRSGITNDPNREDDEQYILKLIKKVVAVSLETVRIVGEIAILNLSI